MWWVGVALLAVLVLGVIGARARRTGEVNTGSSVPQQARDERGGEGRRWWRVPLVMLLVTATALYVAPGETVRAVELFSVPVVLIYVGWFVHLLGHRGIIDRWFPMYDRDAVDMGVMVVMLIALGVVAYGGWRVFTGRWRGEGRRREVSAR